jgi:hypothetical protein
VSSFITRIASLAPTNAYGVPTGPPPPLEELLAVDVDVDVDELLTEAVLVVLEDVAVVAPPAPLVASLLEQLAVMVNAGREATKSARTSEVIAREYSASD